LNETIDQFYTSLGYDDNIRLLLLDRHIGMLQSRTLIDC